MGLYMNWKFFIEGVEVGKEEGWEDIFIGHIIRHSYYYLSYAQKHFDL